jgi:hypothetical protein
MPFANDIASALEGLHRELGSYFTYAGTQIPCVASMAALSANLETGGLGMDQGLRIYVQTADLATPPRVKSVVTYEGKQYTVDSVSASPDGSFHRLECSRYGKGA